MKAYQEVCADLITMLENLEQSLTDILNTGELLESEFEIKDIEVLICSENSKSEIEN